MCDVVPTSGGKDGLEGIVGLSHTNLFIMKQVRVKYTFEITKTIAISDETPPKPYTQEEWESQQIDNVGDDISFQMDGSVSWYRQIIG